MRWHGVGASPDLSRPSHSLAFHLRGASQGDRDVYVMINAYWEPLAFTIQAGPADRWARAIDTSRDAPDDVCEPAHEVPIESPHIVVEPRSVVVLVER